MPFEDNNKQLPFVVISEKQRKRLFAIGKAAGKTDAELKDICREHGFEHSRDITRDKYEEIIEAIDVIKRQPGED